MDGREGSRTSNSCCPCLAPGTVSASSSRCGRTTHSIPPHAQFRSAGRLPVQSSPIQSEPCAGCQRSLQIGQSIRGRDETRRVAAASVPCTCVLARAPASPRSGKVRLGPVVEQLQHSNHHTPPAISSSSRDRARRRCRESLPPVLAIRIRPPEAHWPPCRDPARHGAVQLRYEALLYLLRR